MTHGDWFLEICGEGPSKRDLIQYVAKHHIQGVRFCGSVSPKPYYEQASILCMTSLFEGTPMVIVEAMQCGVVPIIYDTYAAARDMMEDGESDFIIPAFDEEMYVQKLTNLMDDTTLRNMMSQKAVEFSRKFDPNLILSEWEQLFLKLMN